MVFVGYWIVWPIGTLPHGRRVIVPDTVIFGVLWGVSEGLLFGSVWVLTKRFWDGWIGAGTGADFAICFTTIIVLSAFVGSWHALLLGHPHLARAQHLRVEHPQGDDRTQPERDPRRRSMSRRGRTSGSGWRCKRSRCSARRWRCRSPARDGRIRSIPPVRPSVRQTDEPADMTGRTVVVTGGARGMGGMAAGRLAALGAHVVILDVDDATAHANAAQIAQRHGPDRRRDPRRPRVECFGARAAPSRCSGRYPRIDVLLNNAGIFTEMYQENPQGVELSVATNHLGGFLLTQLLLPRLQERRMRASCSSAPTPIVRRWRSTGTT